MLGDYAICSLYVFCRKCLQQLIAQNRHITLLEFFFLFKILLCTGKNIKAKYIYSFEYLNNNNHKQVLPSREISFHGLGGYMKAAFWIWSCMSSSSLNGKVPLRLT